MKENKFIVRIQLDLLSKLFDYVVPFINEKLNIKATQKEKDSKINNLENILNNSKPKIDFKDIKELEAMLFKNLNENIKINKNIGINLKNIFYSLDLTRKKNNDETSENQKFSWPQKFNEFLTESNKYSISINYEENQNEDKLKISVKGDGKEVYSTEITNKKEIRDKVAPYSVKISYQDNYVEERLTITYKQQLKNYMQQHIESKDDMTNRVPLKWLNILPESMMGSVLGFTYLGDNSMGRRADLTGKTARMVDIHESIHTPDEYETRVLTNWIMEKIRTKYLK